MANYEKLRQKTSSTLFPSSRDFFVNFVLRNSVPDQKAFIFPIDCVFSYKGMAVIEKVPEPQDNTMPDEDIFQ